MNNLDFWVEQIYDLYEQGFDLEEIETDVMATLDAIREERIKK